jgi:hypothetical protein
MKNGDNIDYKRKAALVKTLSTKWDATTPLIFSSIQTVLDDLRKNGAAASEFDMILGATAANTFLTSQEYKDYAKIYALSPSDYVLPKMNTTSGGVYHNRISVGPYIVNIWSYPATYTDANGADQDYIDPKKVIIIAKSAELFMSFAAVPRVLTDNGIMQNQQFAQTIENGKYILNNFVKPEVSSHVFEIKSAGVVVPMTIDHFATLTVLS